MGKLLVGIFARRYGQESCHRPATSQLGVIVALVTLCMSAGAYAGLLHNSTAFPGTTKWGGNWGVAGGKYGAFDCPTCHQQHATNIKRIKSSFTPPDGFSVWSSNGSASVSVSFKNVTSMGHDNRVPNTSSSNVCEVCHSRNKYHNWNATRNATFGGVLTHNNGVDCTACHPHDAGFKASESPGNVDCSSCHNDIYSQMNGSTTTYHHFMQNAAVTTLASGSKYPNVATLTTTDTNRRCLMCHVDHDIFRPDLNGVNGGARGKNLRTDATVIASTTTGFTRKDFDNSLTNGGICTSCHQNQQTKNTANQKPNGTTVTPIITKALFAVTMHNYTTNSNVFGDGTKMNANCAKCHDGQNAEASQKTNFGTHDSTARSLFANLGGTLTEIYQPNVCYQCHGNVTPLANGSPTTTYATAAANEWYNVKSMTSRAKNMYPVFNDATLTSKHQVGLANYTSHRPSPVDQNRTWISNHKGITCNDCHNPHAAGANIHPIGFNTISSGRVIYGATGVGTAYTFREWTSATGFSDPPVQATMEYQICAKCHSSYNTKLASWAPSGHTWTKVDKEFSPLNNAGFHPVMGVNANRLTTMGLVNGWTDGKKMYCSDCHGNSKQTTNDPRGPHASANAFVLKKVYDGIPASTATTFLCFDCHDGNNYGTGGTATATGFLVGTSNYHVQHASWGVACKNCHLARPHGWDYANGRWTTRGTALGGTPRGMLLIDGAYVATPYRAPTPVTAGSVSGGPCTSGADCFLYITTFAPSKNWPSTPGSDCSVNTTTSLTPTAHPW